MDSCLSQQEEQGLRHTKGALEIEGKKWDKVIVPIPPVVFNYELSLSRLIYNILRYSRGFTTVPETLEVQSH